jgi:hypothetical protein
MSDTRSPLEALNAFRKMLVEERRQIVSTALELREANGEGGLHGAEFQRIQEQIEALDRAIADETALQPLGV